MLRPSLFAAPTPLILITLAEAKSWVKQTDTTEDDTLITTLINGVVSYLDGYSGILGRALINQVWDQAFCSFGNRLDLPVGIASAITHVKYYDTANAEQTLASSVYQLLSDGRGSFVSLKTSQNWPSIYNRDDAVTIRWTAGYGPAAANVPEAIKIAALMLIAECYKNREATVVGKTIDELPLGVKTLLAPFRIVGL